MVIAIAVAIVNSNKDKDSKVRSHIAMRLKADYKYNT